VKHCAVGSILLATVFFAHGDIVDFSNNRTFAVEADRLVRDMVGNPLIGTNYFAQLYYGNSADSLRPVTSAPARFRLPGTANPGTWLGGNRTLQGFSFGDAPILQVRVWDSTVGGNWEEAESTGFGDTQHGISATFPYQIPPAGCTSPDCFLIENFRGFSLVPEPSVMALAVGGAFIVVLVRRRK